VTRSVIALRRSCPGLYEIMAFMLKAILVTILVAATTVAQVPAHLPMSEQEVQPASADPFIATIAAMKHSVAPVACLETKEGETKIAEIRGSGFFISARGEFVTAGHVIEGMDGSGGPCPITAIFLPATRWQPEVPEEDFIWFPFKIQDCTINREIDAAKCNPLSDLSMRPDFRFLIYPVELEVAKPPDGTQVAYTGFPLRSRDPLTSRAVIATYRTVSQGAAIASEIILDHVAWMGGSGSPVYLSNGRVIGMIFARGTEQSTGIAIVRPVESLGKIFMVH
jgi:hypothetical protein